MAIHAAAFWITVVAVALLALTAGAGLARRRLHRVLLDRLVLVILAASAIGGISGIVLLATGARPTEPLHLLYGAAAPVVVGIARALGRRPEPRQRAGWLLVGALVTGGVLLRLWATGG